MLCLNVQPGWRDKFKNEICIRARNISVPRSIRLVRWLSRHIESKFISLLIQRYNKVNKPLIT